MRRICGPMAALSNTKSGWLAASAPAKVIRTAFGSTSLSVTVPDRINAVEPLSQRGTPSGVHCDSSV